MTKQRQVWAAGFTAVAIYLICTAVAFFNYPLAYSPLANWLSDLGNPVVNTAGAFWYNLGCILAALCLIFFYLGLEIWYKESKKPKILLTITQSAGIISSLCLIIASFYPLGAYPLIHMISGKAHIFFVGFFLSFSATILLSHPLAPKWLAYFGFLAALINFIYGAFLNSIFVAEWAAIGSFIIYVLMISVYTLNRAGTAREDGALRST